jgi:hypothetical protein
VWSTAFLAAWLILFVMWRPTRRAMWLGHAEPELRATILWNPPSLFDLAQRTGFDVESLILSFAIAGRPHCRGVVLRTTGASVEGL